ncbi:MAG: hypothetical protein KatS3mg015_0523 [Fimbriimonadales bacterium]|jgi:hypothetical protein|nr:MAG: hypothetical protein KatS3mg015_0523 [Fimbriimonadales bacterium]
MTVDTARYVRRARRYFFLGWFLAIFNLLSTLWAIWLPIDLIARQKQWAFLWFDYTFFFIDEQTNYAFWATMSIAALFCIMFLQLWLLPRLAMRLDWDIEECDQAAAALSIARFLAGVGVVACFLSFLFDAQRYSSWRTILEFQD